MTMRYVCGIDIGASTAKLVLLNLSGEVIAQTARRSGVDYARTAQTCLEEAVATTGLCPEDLAAALSTGYGRDNVPWATGKMTEIACHSKGAYHHFRRRMTVIDIGAQDSKIIRLDDQGRRLGFQMNRKCAAGTGAFLEEIAYRLDLPVTALNELAGRASKEISLGSFCTVFAATEILEKLRAGEAVENIVKGAFRSVVKRILEMDTVEPPLVLTGGVAAYNSVLVQLVQETLHHEVLVPPDAQFIGALGAALFAREKLEKGDTACSSTPHRLP